MKINVKGNIVQNDSKWIYDWLGMEATSPNDVISALSKANGEDIDIDINSGGGDIFAGSEIYTALRSYQGKVNINIVGLAASAASVIAMAGHTVISPTGLFMIHNVSSYAGGDHNVMERQAQTLRTADQSIANAYKAKTGLSDKELLDLMDKETWLSAEQAIKLKFVDGIMFENSRISLANGPMISHEAEEKLRSMLGHSENKGDFLLQKKEMEALNLLELRGGYKNEI